ncbi:MAG TPA: helicase-related protein [Burkholderiaceae bacterium]
MTDDADADGLDEEDAATAAGPDEDEAARQADPAGQADREALKRRDYRITDADRLGDGGAKTKFRDNIAAIRLLQDLREQGRAAGPDEQAVLVRYVGWGGLPQAFDPSNEDWSGEYRTLRELLPGDDYDRARRSTQDAHYTSDVVVDAIYKGLERLGFAGGQVLEPAAGTGNFLGLMPQAMREASEFTAVELDPTTAEIARHLYPGAAVVNKGFQDVPIPSGLFDAVVGNPPFGSQCPYDPYHADLKGLSIHNYFLAKSIDTLREGGVMAVVVSRFFMDAQDATARELVGQQAHLLGAVRLPNTAFQRNALTAVTTDVLFFQKCRAGETPDLGWTQTVKLRDEQTGQTTPFSRYFHEHPEQMAGSMQRTSGMFQDAWDLVPTPGEDLATAITSRLAALPEGICSAAPETAARAARPEDPAASKVKVGAFFITSDGQVARRLPDIIDRTDHALVPPGPATERIRPLVALREATRGLLSAEKSASTPDAELDERRAALNRTYDDFVRRFGPIANRKNAKAMGEDPEFPLLRALETPDGGKADIFRRRVIQARRDIGRVDTAKEALVVSMNEAGRIDLPRMARLTGRTTDQLVDELSGLIYRDPAKGDWQTADRYLAGDVKAKLKIAEAASKEDPRYEENVAALRVVQPPDVEPVDIGVQLGSAWVPPDVVHAFVGHLLGNVRRTIDYQPVLGRWIVDIPGWMDYTTSTVTWGTEDMPAQDLIKAILTNGAIQVKTNDVNERGEPILRIDQERTSAANQKADEIRQAFVDWVWNDPQRRERLAGIFNDRFNTLVPMKFDGSHLELPGSSPDVELRENQKDAIWRGVQDGTALFDHVVGAGKTYAMVGTAMESKRMGLIDKPMFVVPNHVLLDWERAFQSLYPGANVLVATKDDFEKKNRERLFARIATGQWDAVIVAHSSFGSIGMPEETLKEIIDEQVSDLTSAIARLKAERGERRTIKELEKTKDRLEAKQQQQADNASKDKAVTFADLGVDALFVDEAHEFKNLEIHTSLRRVSGLGNLDGSKKATDLFVKCRYLQRKHGGRGVFFATGTPLTNTLAEVYTMQRFLQYDRMKEKGIHHFDAWVSTFGKIVEALELDTGMRYRMNTRFRGFHNVPELNAEYRSFADVVTQSDLDEQARARGQRFPRPQIEGGKPEIVVAPRSEALAKFMESVVYRMEHLPSDPSVDNLLKISSEARMASLDMRLLDPKAPDDKNSKVNLAVARIFEIWQQTREDRGTQLVFCDLSTPKSEKRSAPAGSPSEGPKRNDGEPASLSMDELLAGMSTFSIYDDIRTKLIKRGVPASEIRFAHEAKDEAEKARMFKDMNDGKIRILLSSTAKAGAGTNVQERLVALHNLDATFRPSDLEQREGRILRQGNLFYNRDPDTFKVRILRYATEQSFDTWMWQTIESKTKGIVEFRRGGALARTMDDIDGAAANAADMKAAASGNPLILKEVQLAADLKKMEAVFKNHTRSLHALEELLQSLPAREAISRRLVAQFTSEIERRDAATPPNDDKRRKAQCAALVANVPDACKQAIKWRVDGANGRPEVVVLGHHRGFEIGVHAQQRHLQFTIQGAGRYEPDSLRYLIDNTMEFNGAGFIARIDNFLQNFESRRDTELGTIENCHLEAEKARVELAKPFAQLEQLEALRKEHREVMAALRIDLDGPARKDPPATDLGEKAAEQLAEVVHRNPLPTGAVADVLRENLARRLPHAKAAEGTTPEGPVGRQADRTPVLARSAARR